MTTLEIINLLHTSIKKGIYDMVPTEKNRNSKRKYGLTIQDIEVFLMNLEVKDLYAGPLKDRDIKGEELFVFIKEIIPGVFFYIKIKKDNRASEDRMKILSCHEAEYRR